MPIYYISVNYELEAVQYSFTASWIYQFFATSVNIRPIKSMNSADKNWAHF